VKAALLYGPWDLKVEEVPKPDPNQDEVLIEVEEVGICGTDKALYKGTYALKKRPLIPGHEVSGKVVSAPVEDLIGRRVTTEINISCGKCWYCRRGMETHCPYRKAIGISADGAMAEFLRVPVKLVHPVELSPEEASFVEPLAAVIETFVMAPPEKGSNVLILGAGTIALLAAQYVKLFSPNLVVITARGDSPKWKVASRYGTFVPVEELEEFKRKETPEGAGFDYVIEATGSPEGAKLALNHVRPRGVVAAKSTHGEEVFLDYTSLVVKEVSLVGSRCGPFDKAIKAISSGIVEVVPLITSKFSLDEAREAFETSLKRDQVKVHIIP